MTRLLLALVVGISGVLAAASPAGQAQRGFAFRLAAERDVQSLDPALASVGDLETSRLQTEIAYATCSTLFSFRSSADPVSLPIPEAAEGPPRVSSDGRTYTIVLRRGLRFSDGSPIDARSYARAIERMRSKNVIGRTRLLAAVSRVRAQGRTLTITLRAPAGDLPARLAAAPFCPVPRTTPLAPVESVPSSGPYVVWERVANQRIVLRRNRYYRGSRPRRPSEIVITLGGTAVANIRAAQAGSVDVVHKDPEPEDVEALRLNRSDLHQNPYHNVVYIALNTARPLFRNNPRLRRAINFAMDRKAQVAIRAALFGAVPTDQIVPRGAPGFAEARIYPLGGDLRRARELARGNVRDGRAVMYATPQGLQLGAPQAVRATLAKIGIEVEFKLLSRPVIEQRLANPDEPYDLAITARQTRPADMRYPDPIWYLRAVHGGWKPPYGDNVSRFDERRVNRLLNAANRLHGRARLRALGRLDAEIMRTYAPIVPLYQQPRNFYAAGRIGCLRFVLDLLDYGAICRRG